MLFGLWRDIEGEACCGLHGVKEWIGKVLTLEVRIGLEQDLGCSGVGERKETAFGMVLE